MTKLVSLIMLLCACHTTSSTFDALLPDRYGVGTSFGKYSYLGRTTSSGDGSIGGGGETTGENGRGNVDLTAIWFEWDIPSINGRDVSFTGMRESLESDYRELRTKDKPAGLLSVSKLVDEETGEETWSIGASEALTTAIIGIFAALAYKMRKRKNGRNNNNDHSE